MSKLGQIKQKVGYVSNVNRCFNCQHFKEQSIRLSTDSQTYRKHHHCGIGGFTVSVNGICSGWITKAKPGVSHN